MSSKFNEAWTVREKTELLVNILQVQSPDPTPYLVQALLDTGLRPQWEHVGLPKGRSLQACRQMFDTLLQQHQRPAQQYPIGVPQATSPYPATIPPPRLYGEQPPFQAQLQPHPRAIQPRPSHSTDSPNPASSNGDSLTIVRTSGADLNVEKRKKRGRPTKEEAQERDRQYAAEGKVYEPKKRPAKKFRASTGTSIPVSDALLSASSDSPPLKTPLPQTTEAHEGSSSGKRRPKRQGGLTVRLPDEPGSPTARLPSDQQGESTLQSPSDRLLARLREPSRDRSASEQLPPRELPPQQKQEPRSP